MGFLVPSNFSYYNAQIFKERFSSKEEFIYAFLAKHTPWADDSSPTTSELTPVSTTLEEIKNWNEILALKHVLPKHVGYVLRRHNWTTGTVYSKYKDNVKMEDVKNTTSPHYVISNNKVYQCLDNSGGAASTVNPSTVSNSTLTTGVIRTSDNYLWKYMYQISAACMTKWSNENFIPVFELESDDTSHQWDVMKNAVDGGVYVIEGLVAADVGKAVTLVGDGTGFTATVAASGSYVYANVTNPGSGYRNVTAVQLNGTTDSDLTAIIPPKGGYGWDARKQLCGHYVMISLYFFNDESAAGGIFYDNDYRKYGLIAAPINKVSTTGITQSYDDINLANNLVLGERASSDVRDQRVRLTYTSITGISESDFATKSKDILVSMGTNTGKVVHVDSTNNYIYVLPTREADTFSNFGSTSLSCTIESAAVTVNVSAKVDADLLRYSGEIIYEVYLDAAGSSPYFPVRSNSQSDEINIVIEF
tara:strand:+ start:8553 stop:9980 length:1428 start_codon:yes stop_codon:yes gene_type:complete